MCWKRIGNSYLLILWQPFLLSLLVFRNGSGWLKVKGEARAYCRRIFSSSIFQSVCAVCGSLPDISVLNSFLHAAVKGESTLGLFLCPSEVDSWCFTSPKLGSRVESASSEDRIVKVRK